MQIFFFYRGPTLLEDFHGQRSSVARNERQSLQGQTRVTLSFYCRGEHSILVWVSLNLCFGRVDINFSESVLSVSILLRLALFSPVPLLDAVVVSS